MECRKCKFWKYLKPSVYDRGIHYCLKLSPFYACDLSDRKILCNGKYFEPKNSPITNQTMEQNEIKIVEIKEGEGYHMPTKSTEDAAAWDVYVARDTVLKMGGQLIPLGFSIALPVDECAHILPKSGYSLAGIPVHTPSTSGITDPKKLPRIKANVIIGTVDADYRGEVNAILQVTDEVVSNGKIWLQAGQQIAQMKISPVEKIRFQKVFELSPTNRGSKGFGEADGEGAR